MRRCGICGTDLKSDLFAEVTGDTSCAICKVKYVGGLPTTPERIAAARARLGFAEGQYLIQDNAKEAARILGKPEPEPIVQEVPRG